MKRILRVESLTKYLAYGALQQSGMLEQTVGTTLAETTFSNTLDAGVLRYPSILQVLSKKNFKYLSKTVSPRSIEYKQSVWFESFGHIWKRYTRKQKGRNM